jgi:hypothetical protein
MSCSGFRMKDEAFYILKNRMEEAGKVNLNRSVGGRWKSCMGVNIRESN